MIRTYLKLFSLGIVQNKKYKLFINLLPSTDLIANAETDLYR